MFLTMLADSTMQQTLSLVPESTTLFSLPQELRDLIYSYLFQAVHPRSGEIVPFRMRPSNEICDRGEFKLSDRLAILRVSRRLWDESSRILYGKHLFRFHLGCSSTNAAFLTQRTVYLMQNIEISMCTGDVNESLLIVHIFSASQKLWNSCSIKVQLRPSEWITDNIAYALKKLNRVKFLVIDVNEPVLREWRRRYRWQENMLHDMNAILETWLGPSIDVADDVHPRLIFRPQDHMRQMALVEADP